MRYQLSVLDVNRTGSSVFCFLIAQCVDVTWNEKGPKLPDEAVCDTARMPHVEDLMSPSKVMTCFATGTYYTSIADLRYAVCIYNTYTVILQRFVIINIPLQAASSPEDIQWRRLGIDFSDGYPPNEWLAKAHPSQVPKILCWPGSSWKGLTLATRCCCHSNVWHQKPFGGSWAGHCSQCHLETHRAPILVPDWSDEKNIEVV